MAASYSTLERYLNRPLAELQRLTNDLQNEKNEYVQRVCLLQGILQEIVEKIKMIDYEKRLVDMALEKSMADTRITGRASSLSSIGNHNSCAIVKNHACSENETVNGGRSAVNTVTNTMTTGQVTRKAETLEVRQSVVKKTSMDRHASSSQDSNDKEQQQQQLEQKPTQIHLPQKIENKRKSDSSFKIKYNHAPPHYSRRGLISDNELNKLMKCAGERFIETNGESMLSKYGEASNFSRFSCVRNLVKCAVYGTREYVAQFVPDELVDEFIDACKKILSNM